MSRIFWDSNLFIYLLEGTGETADRVAMLRQRMKERGDQLCTSALTLGEVLVKPVSEGRKDLVDKYYRALTSATVLMLSFDRECARRYAEIRQDRAIRAPDALQLACAANADCNLFITNDERLSRKNVAGIDFIVSLQKAFL